MFKEFKAFILRGNVVDLAVGVVIGAAFGDVVTSLVENVVTPIVAIPGSVEFSELDIVINDSSIRYGVFLNALIAFLLIAAAVFFFVVKPLNALVSRRKTGPEVEPTTRDCPRCLSAVPTAASRCAFCTADIAPVG
ncbi:MAG: large conductance mechanosensitive channel protein MscL [Acidimicrobiales bacterium]